MYRFFPLFVLFLIAGCTANSPDKPLTNAHFFLRYLEDGQEIKAQATFIQTDSAGRQEQIDLPGGATFQGSGMGKKQVTETVVRYQYENTGSFPEDYRFGCREETGMPWTEFSYSMIPLRRFQLDDSLVTGSGATLLLPDGPLLPGETLVMIFTNAKREASSVAIAGPTEGNAVRIQAAKMRTLTPGTYSYYLVKKSVRQDTIRPFAAIMEAEYYSAQDTLIVLPAAE